MSDLLGLMDRALEVQNRSKQGSTNCRVKVNSSKERRILIDTYLNGGLGDKACLEALGYGRNQTTSFYNYIIRYVRTSTTGGKLTLKWK